MQKLEFNKKYLLLVPLLIVIILGIFRLMPNVRNQEATASLAQEIFPEDRILLLAPIYMAFTDYYPEFDKFTQEEIQPVCPLYVPDTKTYRGCVDKILEFKMLTEGISEEKADQAEKTCTSMILNFGTASNTEPNMLIDVYNACLWYKLDT